MEVPKQAPKAEVKAESPGGKNGVFGKVEDDVNEGDKSMDGGEDGGGVGMEEDG